MLDMTYLLLIAGACSIIFSRLKLPPIIGYLVAGIILGPTMLEDVSVDPSTISMLSNLGIVLLMFSIGLNLNLQRMRKLGSFTFIVLSLEMPFMVVCGYIAGLAMGLNSVASIFLGAVISGTSPAVVVAVLHERGESVDKEVTSTATAITVLEDLGQVFILSMAAPLLVGDTPALGSVALMAVSIAIFIGMSLFLGIRIVPRLLNWIGRKYPPEVLLIVSIGLCFLMALISNLIGLSIAIGAFLMGLIVSQAARSEEVAERVDPMKEVFMAVFFISIGIQIVPAEIINNLDLVFIIAIVFTVAKIAGVSLASYLVRGDPRFSFMTAISLVAMGEFAFIIAKTALDAGVVDQQFYASVIGAAIVTMVALPILSKSSPRIYNAMASAIPTPLQTALGRFDSLREDVRRRATVTPETSHTIKWELILIFVDLLTIVIIQTLFYGLNFPRELVDNLAKSLHMLPGLITIMLSMLLMLPAVINMFQGIKRIAHVLAQNGGVPGRIRATRTKRLYRTFRNLGEVAAVLLVALLFLPFLAETLGVPTSIWVSIGILTMVLILMSWRSYRHARRDGTISDAKKEVCLHEHDGNNTEIDTTLDGHKVLENGGEKESGPGGI